MRSNLIVLLGLQRIVSEVSALRYDFDASLVTLGKPEPTLLAPWGGYRGAVVGNWFILVGDEWGRYPNDTFDYQRNLNRHLFIDLSPINSTEIIAYEPTFPSSNQPPIRTNGWSRWHEAVSLNNSKLVVFDFGPAEQVSVFDAAAGGKWTNFKVSDFKGEHPSIPRYGCAVTAVSSTQILIHGGHLSYKDTSTTPHGDFYMLDLEEMTWTKLPDANSPKRALHSMGFIDRYAVIYGGFNTGMNVVGANVSQIVNTDLYLFDFVKMKWIFLDSKFVDGVTPQRVASASAVTFNQKMYLYAGYIGDVYIDSKVSILSYNPTYESWGWTHGKNFEPRAVQAAGVTTNGYMPIWTGHKQPPYYEYINVYSIEANRWTNRSAIAEPTFVYNPPSSKIRIEIPQTNNTTEEESIKTDRDPNSGVLIGLSVAVGVLSFFTIGSIIYFLSLKAQKKRINPPDHKQNPSEPNVESFSTASELGDKSPDSSNSDVTRSEFYRVHETVLKSEAPVYFEVQKTPGSQITLSENGYIELPKPKLLQS